jgi:hypothetical protein
MAALIVSSLSDLQSPVEERLEALNYCHNVLIEDKVCLLWLITVNHRVFIGFTGRYRLECVGEDFTKLLDRSAIA